MWNAAVSIEAAKARMAFLAPRRDLMRRNCARRYLVLTRTAAQAADKMVSRHESLNNARDAL
jgi:hypothetical protein